MAIDPKTKSRGVYFSDYFGVSEKILEGYGAFNISLIADLPLFIDPFLLFNSDKAEYQTLHDEIIGYIAYLHDLSVSGTVVDGLIKQLYRFPEIKENWLGYSGVGNAGRGLGPKFAKALNRNFNNVLNVFRDETVTEGSHLEKLTLIDKGVGRDSISDFTTNLVLRYLLEYTQKFAGEHLKSEQRKTFRVPHVEFKYSTQSWAEMAYELPLNTLEDREDYVILTPEDILTKDKNWINRPDLLKNFERVPSSIPNDELRAKINHYFWSILPKEPSEKERKQAAQKTLLEFPIIYEYYIRDREKNGSAARVISAINVENSKQLYIEKYQQLPILLASSSDFYKIIPNSYEDAYTRVLYLKQVVENNDGYRIFWKGENLLIRREDDIHVLYKLTWFLTLSDVNQEVNNGRGPVDFKVSRGSVDKSLVEFKLASNPKLKQNLEKQVVIYEKANETKRSIKVIFYFTNKEKIKLDQALEELNLSNEKSIVLIDARRDNKTSASRAR